MDWNHVEAVEEVFSESALPDSFFKISMGCSQDANIDLTGLCGTNRPFSLLQHLTEPPVWQKATLISSVERATVSLYKDLVRMGVREGPFLVAEQLRFDERFWNRTQLMATKGPVNVFLRGELPATNSLPVPDSPFSTVVP